MEENAEALVDLVCRHTFTLYESADWTIAKYTTAEDRETVTAVGTKLPTTSDVSVKLTGQWQDNPKYGRQFSVAYYEVVLPVTRKGMVSYLRSLKVGVGVVKANALYSMFGEKLWEILDEDPKQITRVPGVSDSIADHLSEKLQETRQIRSIIRYFQGEMDVTMTRANAILNQFGNTALQLLEQKPYLLSTVPGFGYEAVDRWALGRGADLHDPMRMDFCIRHIFQRARSRGHVCLPAEDLYSEMSKYLFKKKTEETLAECREAVHRAFRNGDVKAASQSTSQRYYPTKEYREERYLARRLKELAGREELNVDIGYLLKRYRDDTGVTLAAKQEEAVACALNHTLSVITGGPGVGKTTTINALLYCYKLYNGNAKDPILLAPTGRAARRMSEATGYPANTIHAAIGYTEREGEAVATATIDADLIIVDECSMVDQQIAYLLLKSISRNDTKIVLVGDPDQLPSVGCGNILHDVILSGSIPLVKLDVIFRQAEGSPVIKNAHAINTGDTKLTYTKGFKFIPCYTTEETIDKTCSFYLRCVKAYGLDDVALLCPYRKKTVICVDVFNKKLQEALNPERPGEYSIRVHGLCFRPRDKVMQTKNTDAAKNGDIGYIRSITRRGNPDDPKDCTYIATIEFNGDGILLEYDEEMLRDVTLGYCTTIHKSQGSQYKTVIMVVHSLHSNLLKRKTVYTAVTRSSENVCILGEEKALNAAILEEGQDEVRYTMLTERLQQS